MKQDQVPLAISVMFILVVVKLLEVYLERVNIYVCLQKVDRGLIEKLAERYDISSSYPNNN